jgi:hypothetical protein
LVRGAWVVVCFKSTTYKRSEFLTGEIYKSQGLIVAKAQTQKSPPPLQAVGVKPLF